MRELNAAIKDITMPVRMMALPVSDKGFPIPRFVAWVRDGRQTRRLDPDGKPDFRIIDSEFAEDAFRRKRCWLCGELLGRHQVFAIGPMCVVNRVTMEPPSHRDCAEYAVKACPFLSKPRMIRNEKGLELYDAAGIPGMSIDRNPGCVCLYETRSYKRFHAGGGGSGMLVQLGPPDRVDWWAQGRQAMREEIIESIDSGYPLLMKMAIQDGPKAVAELERYRQRAEPLIPK